MSGGRDVHSMVIRHRPVIRLTRLARRKGGMTRDEAIAQAEQYVEEVRGISMTSLKNIIDGLEVLNAASQKHGFIDLREIRRRADQIITIAGTYGVPYLVRVAKMLCDLANNFEKHGIGDIAPIAVHISALRLLEPSDVELVPAMGDAILAELTKVAEHFGIVAQTEVEDLFVEYCDDAADNWIDPR